MIALKAPSRAAFAAFRRRFGPVRASVGLHTDADIGEDEDKYLELRQLRDIKSEEFYDSQAEHRRYFYYIDLQGRLFLEDTRPKNIATSLKSAKFLRFFFSQVQPNDPSRAQDPALAPLLEYPFKSPCGKEMNFIKCADRPFVLESLRRSEASGEWLFSFGGGEMTMPLRPETLRVSVSTGRLYHDVQTRHVSPGTPEGTALVRSQLAVEIAKHMDIHDTFSSVDIDQAKNEEVVIGEFVWDNQRFPVRVME